MLMLRKENRLGSKGQAMVETAFVIFFLLVLVFGMTEFGRAMYTKNTLINAARAGARSAVVTPASAYPNPLPAAVTLNCPNNSNPIYTAVCNSIVAGVQDAAVTIQISDAGGNPVTDPTTIVAGYSVTVQTQATFTPVLNLFKPSTNNPLSISSTLTGQATMRYE